VWLLHAGNYKALWNHEHYELTKIERRELISKMLKREELGLSVKLPIIYTPHYVDIRMSAQESNFMVWGAEPDSLEVILETVPRYEKYSYFMEELRYPPLLDGILYKITIPANKKRQVLRELDLVGISEKTLFPGLEGVGKYIERKYQNLRFTYEHSNNHT